jgi:prepilin-type N-terminal cleavage/methylation domain-containing protein
MNLPPNLRNLFNERGFSLVEIAIVLVIIGLLTGGGISLMGMLTERKSRNDTIDYLKQARETLIAFAANSGRFPWADTDNDGTENSGAASGTLPYSTLQLSPTDPYKRVLGYALHAGLGNNRTDSCSALRSGLSGAPRVVDADGTATAFTVSAVLISPGPMDADSNGNVFDTINSGIHRGDNTDGTPNYLRHPQIMGFDDLVVYIGGNELFGNLCEYLTVAVNNNFTSTIYVYDANQGSDLGTIPPGNAALYDIISGTRIEILDGAGGSGTPVASTPPTPIILAGRGTTITVP